LIKDDAFDGGEAPCGAHFVSERVEEARGLERARAGDEHAFRDLVEPYRRELRVHCYRILGSLQDAEDLVQETLLAAWRGLDGFRGEAGVRSWLYRIATNTSLNELRRRGRRPRDAPVPPQPSGEPPPAEPPKPSRIVDSVWLEPFPDDLLEGVPDLSDDPGVRYDTREAIELAFMTAVQTLPPRQRAVLVLRDVLGFRASEAAEIMSSTVAGVNGALARARKQLEEQQPTRRESVRRPSPGAERELIRRFADAFERGDVEALVALLTEDAKLAMPPQPFEYHGRQAIGAFFSTVPAGGAIERIRLVPTRANGQPAFACYLRELRGPRQHAYGLMVVTLTDEGVARITGFTDPSVFPAFGLPRTLRED
jgi:RNA polymerase sigma-70 factor (TIGR02960 family)